MSTRSIKRDIVDALAWQDFGGVRRADHQGVGGVQREIRVELDDARMRRAGLDYHEWQPVRVHDTLQEALDDTGASASHIYALTTQAQRSVGDVRFEPGDVFVFGRESAGLSATTAKVNRRAPSAGAASVRH